MSITKEISKRDTAIHIMGMKMGQVMSCLVREQSKPKEERDLQKIMDIKAELTILNKERMQMYAGDEKIINKIYNSYGMKKQLKPITETKTSER